MGKQDSVVKSALSEVGMKKSIFLLFLLLMGCAPVATVAPTLTPLPPTSTVTPSPTATLEPTITPSAPREAEGGGVEVWDGTKWVKVEIPNTIWGDKPEGASIVLKDGEAVLQMELNNFQTPDGSTSVDIAKYNAETKKWEVKPFSITRSTAEGVNFYKKNSNLVKVGPFEKILTFNTLTSILGIKVEKNSRGGMSLHVMDLYKGRVLVFHPDDASVQVVNPTTGPVDYKLLNPEKIGLKEALEIIRTLNLTGKSRNNGSFFLSFYATQNGITSDNCNRLDIYNSQSLRDWCLAEVNKGENRKTLNKDNVDYILTNSPNPILLDENSNFNNLPSFWDEAFAPPIDGAFLFVGFTDKSGR